MSEYYEKQRKKLLIEILNGNEDDPTGHFIKQGNNLALIEYNKKRSGRPKYNWYLHALEKYWSYLYTNNRRVEMTRTFDIHNKVQTKIIIEEAQRYTGYHNY